MKKSAGIQAMIAAAVLAAVSLCPAAPITRVDIYDKSDNHLLFATFDYDGTGKNTGRSVFTSDSTFLRSTTFGPSGTAAKETSIDFNNNPVFVTTINAPVAGKTAFSTVDRFGLTHFGPSMNYQETSANNYDITQNGVLSCKEQYEFGANGDLNKITVLDKNGTLAWYALVMNQVSAVTNPLNLIPLRSSLFTANRGRVRIRFDLAETGAVRAELFTAAGRRAAILINGKYTGGTHFLTVSASGADGIQLGNGTYIVRMTVNGAAAVNSRLLLQQQ